MDLALAFTTLLLGLAGSVHCVAMCSAPSAAAVRACSGGARGSTHAWTGFHVGRLLGYAAAGAVAAASVGALETFSAAAPVLRPVWTLLHVAALALGAWLLVTGRQPAWLERVGRAPAAARPDAAGWQRMQGPVKAAAAGVAWAAWPCGLLQSALVVAALANTPAGGALAMGAFGLASAPALGLAPWLWMRWQSGGGVAGQAALSLDAARVNAWAIRVAGALLVGASAWAMGHDLITDAVLWCVS
ncbi:sulfite exporter TauE/SafE family protein [Ideonella sp.]|uniref:sulfite exporter TauE/SafE family protein n=1 Tax=Ideonella sp. TaxID=1929293 RepID=UPI0035B0BA56